MATLALSSCRKSSTRVRRYCTVWSLLMWPKRLYKVLAHCWGASFATWLKGGIIALKNIRLQYFATLSLLPWSPLSSLDITEKSSWLIIWDLKHVKSWNTRHRADALTGGSSASWRAAPWPRPRAAVGRWSLRYSGLKKRGRLLLPSRH